MTRTAAQAHAEKSASVAAKMALLQKLIAQQKAGADGQINWAHVGSMAHIDEKLGELIDFFTAVAA